MTPRSFVPILLVTVTAATASCRQTKAPLVGPDGSRAACVVALAPSPQRNDTDREIARLQEQARREPNSRLALEQLGYRYVARARVANDPGDYKLAEKTAECIESTSPDDAAALLLRGHVLHQLHRFREAEAIARRLIVKRQFVLDYGLLGDVLMEQGRLTEAAQAYQKMIDLKPFYQSYTRASHLRWLKGDLDGAIELIRMAIAAASPRDPESIAWASTRLAGYELQRGRLEDAARAVDSALSNQPDYAAALLMRGRVFLAMKKTSDALTAFSRAAQLNPLPEYQWALGDALRLHGDHEQAGLVENELTSRGAEADARTLALFLATRRTAVTKAIALAERELQARADVFSLDALAWSLASAGRTAEAQATMTRALADGTEDGRLFLHAGVIAAAGDRRAEARKWLRKAEALRSTLLPSELDELTKHLTRLSTQEKSQS
ncbi:MAG TPA: tetratricopeptide repeat protein [Vicinamibacterales bacterium]|nr:tetratricopeptide repeat protein [Vicinamibacterales bacterium]